jgi:phosphatidate cytidylyltransferase
MESIFKRCVGAKDSAILLPGFGGILDMIDSPLVATPVAWFLLCVVWPPV